MARTETTTLTSTPIVGSDGECLGCGAECVADAAGEYACRKCEVYWTVKAGAQ